MGQFLVKTGEFGKPDFTITSDYGKSGCGGGYIIGTLIV